MLTTSNSQPILSCAISNNKNSRVNGSENALNSYRQCSIVNIPQNKSLANNSAVIGLICGLSTSALNASKPLDREISEKDVIKLNNSGCSNLLIKVDASLEQHAKNIERETTLQEESFQSVGAKYFDDIKENTEKVAISDIEPTLFLNESEKANIDNFLLDSNVIDNEPFSNNFNKKVAYTVTQSKNQNSNHFTEYKKNIFVGNQVNNELSNQKSSRVLPMLADKECLSYNRGACSKTLNNHNTLNDHCDGRYEIKPFQCKICYKIFERASALKRHNLTHLDARPFECDICYKSFKSKPHLKQHSLRHTKVKSFQCEICSKFFFIQAAEFKSHLIMHSDVKPFQCDICHKSFKRKQNLKQHYFTHSKLRPFQCEICYKSFQRMPDLKKHRETHSIEKKLICHICNKAYRSKRGLSRHCKLHRVDGSYSCELCNKEFSNKQKFANHMINHMRNHKKTK